MLSVTNKNLQPTGEIAGQKIWVKGRFENKNEKCVAIIGSRRMTEYGRRVIEKMVPPLIEEGWTIVSGFMYGVDQTAHSIALECGGRTIAVLGWGIDYKGITNNDLRLMNPEMVRRWLGTGNKRTEVFSRNIEAIIALEAVQLGSVKVLNQDFRICNFGAWPIELLQRQYETRSDPDLKDVCFESTTDDHNGSFFGYPTFEAVRNLNQVVVNKGYVVRVYEADGRKELLRNFAYAYRKYGDLGPRIYRAHGWREGFKIGRKKEDLITISDLKPELTGQLKKRIFKPGSPELWISCETAAQGGFVEKAAREFDAPRTGPDNTSWVTEITPIFDNTNTIVRFDAKYKTGEENSGVFVKTMTYGYKA